MLALYVDRGTSKIGSFGLNGANQVLAKDSAGDDMFSLSRDGHLAFALGDPDHPPDVGVTSPQGVTRRLTNLNALLLDNVTLAQVRAFDVRSSADGQMIGGWAVLPPLYDPTRRYPVILDLHGGPYGQDEPYWQTDVQLFAASGYVVICTNYRGSTSYGSKFSLAISYDFQGAAYADVMSVVDAAVAQRLADPDGLYVTGASAGGELTAWIIGKTSRFRAAVAVKPVIDQISEALDTD